MTYAEALLEFKRNYWIKTLARCKDVAEAARQAKVNRTHLYQIIKNLGIPYKRKRPDRPGNALWRSLAD